MQRHIDRMFPLILLAVLVALVAASCGSSAPAVITVLALLFLARRFRQPAALGRPYEREG